MLTKKLNLPFGTVQVLLNNNAIEFEYRDSSYHSFYINDEEVKVLGALDLIINPNKFKLDDNIFITCDAGNLMNDGGGEGTVNAVAELKEYTYGIGGPDTEFIEWNFGSIPGDAPDSRKHRYKQHILSYELSDISAYGLRYKIVNGIDNAKYANGNIYISIVWESNLKPYAYDIVSFLTC